jgi:N-acetylglucosamine-6-phosphate deacetylase
MSSEISLLKSAVTKVTNVKMLDEDSNKLISSELWFSDGVIIDPKLHFWNCNQNKEELYQELIDGQGMILVPGFIDIQINGAYGVDFSLFYLLLSLLQKRSIKIFL